jgi:hypothetical protein
MAVRAGSKRLLHQSESARAQRTKRTKRTNKVLTELDHTHIFMAYCVCANDHEEPIEEVSIVRHIAGTLLRLD